MISLSPGDKSTVRVSSRVKVSVSFFVLLFYLWFKLKCHKIRSISSCSDGLMVSVLGIGIGCSLLPGGGNFSKFYFSTVFDRVTVNITVILGKGEKGEGVQPGGEGRVFEKYLAWSVAVGSTVNTNAVIESIHLKWLPWISVNVSNI